MYIFIDSSVNPQINRAIGAYLILSDAEYMFINDNLHNHIDIKEYLHDKLQYYKLDSNSSTSAELETAQRILSMDVIKQNPLEPKYLYTDCTNLYNLNRNYSPTHNNAKLYDDLNAMTTQLNVQILKAKGHCKQALQLDTWQKIFSMVDKHARMILRQVKNR
jgi:hypothetical protein